jgi:predicted transcriptional regulator
MVGNRYRRIAHRSGTGVAKLLGELELAVMEVIWARQSVTVRDVLEVLREERELAYTTVMTVMSRLAEKGLLLVNKEGRAYRYQAAQSREEMEVQAVGRVVQSLLADFDGDIAVNQFVEQLSTIDPEQLARLAELAQQAQEERDER